MPDAVYLFTLIKFGLIGLTVAISLKGIFKNTKLSYFNAVNSILL